jgi:hypothetical protein
MLNFYDSEFVLERYIGHNNDSFKKRNVLLIYQPEKESTKVASYNDNERLCKLEMYNRLCNTTISTYWSYAGHFYKYLSLDNCQDNILPNNPNIFYDEFICSIG